MTTRLIVTDIYWENVCNITKILPEPLVNQFNDYYYHVIVRENLLYEINSRIKSIYDDSFKNEVEFVLNNDWFINRLTRKIWIYGLFKAISVWKRI